MTSFVNYMQSGGMMVVMGVICIIVCLYYWND